MRKIQVKVLIYSIVFIIGVMILMNSVGLGENVVEERLIRQGSMQNIVMYYEQYIANFRFLGSIISIVGGLGVVLSIKFES